MIYKIPHWISVPRTNLKIPPAIIDQNPIKADIAQVKMNGDNSQISWGHNHSHIMNRHGKFFSFTLPESISSTLSKFLPNDSYTVLNAEWINKNKIKKTIYIFDLLVYKSEYLHGTTYSERYSLLEKLFPICDSSFAYHVIAPDIWLARNHPPPFAPVFDQLDPEHEGLMLKASSGRLRVDGDADSWMIRARKSRPNFSF